MDTVLFTRDVWLPKVLATGDALWLEVVGGADVLHEPREFLVPVREEHLAALERSLPRHVLLNAALSPLCYAAGVRGDWDEQAAASLVDVVLLGTPAEVDAVLRGAEVNERQLIAHGASLPALEEGRYVEAVQPVTVGSDWERVRRHDGR